MPGAPLRPLLRCPAATVSGVLGSPVREVRVAGALGALSPFSRLFSAFCWESSLFSFSSSCPSSQLPLLSAAACPAPPWAPRWSRYCQCRHSRLRALVFGGGFSRLVLHGHLLLARVGLAAERHPDLASSGSTPPSPAGGTGCAAGAVARPAAGAAAGSAVGGPPCDKAAEAEAAAAPRAGSPPRQPGSGRRA